MDAGIILKNKVLDIVFLSMIVAQLYKFISVSIIEKKLAWSRLWNTGGMPSSHTSSVVALTTSIAFTEGISSGMFAICVVFSIIVMYDAAGIRKAAGEHAGIINQFTEFLNTVFEKKFKHENLKELLGHSRSEVFAGAVLGFLIAFMMKGYLLK
jgi:uncharacterized protein